MINPKAIDGVRRQAAETRPQTELTTNKPRQVGETDHSEINQLLSRFRNIREKYDDPEDLPTDSELGWWGERRMFLRGIIEELERELPIARELEKKLANQIKAAEQEIVPLSRRMTKMTLPLNRLNDQLRVIDFKITKGEVKEMEGLIAASKANIEATKERLALLVREQQSLEPEAVMGKLGWFKAIFDDDIKSKRARHEALPMSISQERESLGVEEQYCTRQEAVLDALRTNLEAERVSFVKQREAIEAQMIEDGYYALRSEEVRLREEVVPLLNQRMLLSEAIGEAVRVLRSATEDYQSRDSY